MKKTLIVIALISIFLTGCANKITNPEPNINDEQDQVSQLEKPLLSSIPKAEFTNLQLQDFPSFRLNYNQHKAIIWNETVFLVSHPYVIQYDLNGNIISYTNWRKIECAQDIEIVNDFLYIACWGKGIYEVDLNKNEITHLFDEQNGLLELHNLQLSTDSNNLWVATFNGVGKISLKDKKIKFYQDELKIGGDFFDTRHLRANANQVWAVISANAYSSGGIAKYDEQKDTWTAYSTKDLKQNDTSRIDVDKLIVSTEGVYATFQDGGPENFVLKKFDSAQNKWNLVYSAPYLEFEKDINAQLPPLESYSQFNFEFNTVPMLQVFHNSKWVTIPFQGKQFLASTPLVKDSYYLLHQKGLDILTMSDKFPKNIETSKVITDQSDSSTKMFVTNDQKYIIFMSVEIQAYGGAITRYNLGVYNTETKGFFDKEFSGEELAKQLNFYKEENTQENIPEIGEKTELIYQDKKAIIPFNEKLNLIVIDLENKEISAFKPVE